MSTAKTVFALGLGMVAAGAVVYVTRPDLFAQIMGKPGGGAHPGSPPPPQETTAYIDASGKAWAGNVVAGQFNALEPVNVAAYPPPATAPKGHAFAMVNGKPVWSKDLGAMPMTGGNPRAGHDDAKSTPSAPAPAPAATHAAPAAPAAPSPASQILGGATKTAGDIASQVLGGGGASGAVSGIGDALGGVLGGLGG